MSWVRLWVPSANGAGWEAGKLHYPVSLPADSWRSNLIHERSFYAIGTRSDKVQALNHNKERTQQQVIAPAPCPPSQFAPLVTVP